MNMRSVQSSDHNYVNPENEIKFLTMDIDPSEIPIVVRVKNVCEAWEQIIHFEDEIDPSYIRVLLGTTVRLSFSPLWKTIGLNDRLALRAVLSRMKSWGCRIFACLLPSPWGNVELFDEDRKNLDQNSPEHDRNTDHECTLLCDTVPRNMLKARIELLCYCGLHKLALQLCLFYRQCKNYQEDYFYAEKIFYLLFYSGDIKRMVEEIRHLTCHEGLQLIQYISSSRGSSAHQLIECLTQILLVRDLLGPSPYCCTLLLMETWCKLHYQQRTESLVIAEEAGKLGSLAVTSAHLYLLVDVLYNQYGRQLLPLYLKLYIHALTIDINNLEYAKQIDCQASVTELETNMANVYTKLASLLDSESGAGLARECLLTAFSLEPTADRLKDLACRAPLKSVWRYNRTYVFPCQGECHCTEKGLCRRDNELPPWYLTDVPNGILDASLPGVSSMILQDLCVLVEGPRCHWLSWNIPWSELCDLCIHYIDSARELRFGRDDKIVGIDSRMRRLGLLETKTLDVPVKSVADGAILSQNQANETVVNAKPQSDVIDSTLNVDKNVSISKPPSLISSNEYPVLHIEDKPQKPTDNLNFGFLLSTEFPLLQDLENARVDSDHTLIEKSFSVEKSEKKDLLLSDENLNQQNFGRIDAIPQKRTSNSTFILPEINEKYKFPPEVSKTDEIRKEKVASLTEANPFLTSLLASESPSISTFPSVDVMRFSNLQKSGKTTPDPKLQSNQTSFVVSRNPSVGHAMGYKQVTNVNNDAFLKQLSSVIPSVSTIVVPTTLHQMIAANGQTVQMAPNARMNSQVENSCSNKLNQMPENRKKASKISISPHKIIRLAAAHKKSDKLIIKPPASNGFTTTAVPTLNLATALANMQKPVNNITISNEVPTLVEDNKLIDGSELVIDSTADMTNVNFPKLGNSPTSEIYSKQLVSPTVPETPSIVAPLKLNISNSNFLNENHHSSSSLQSISNILKNTQIRLPLPLLKTVSSLNPTSTEAQSSCGINKRFAARRKPVISGQKTKKWMSVLNAHGVTECRRINNEVPVEPISCVKPELVVKSIAHRVQPSFSSTEASVVGEIRLNNEVPIVKKCSPAVLQYNSVAISLASLSSQTIEPKIVNKVKTGTTLLISPSSYNLAGELDFLSLNSPNAANDNVPERNVNGSQIGAESIVIKSDVTDGSGNNITNFTVLPDCENIQTTRIIVPQFENISSSVPKIIQVPNSRTVPNVCVLSAPAETSSSSFISSLTNVTDNVNISTCLQKANFDFSKAKKNNLSNKKPFQKKARDSSSTGDPVEKKEKIKRQPKKLLNKSEPDLNSGVCPISENQAPVSSLGCASLSIAGDADKNSSPSATTIEVSSKCASTLSKLLSQTLPFPNINSDVFSNLFQTNPNPSSNCAITNSNGCPQTIIPETVTESNSDVKDSANSNPVMLNCLTGTHNNYIQHSVSDVVSANNVASNCENRDSGNTKKPKKSRSANVNKQKCFNLNDIPLGENGIIAKPNKKISPTTLYTCDICNKSLASKASVSRHKLKLHKSSIEPVTKTQIENAAEDATMKLNKLIKVATVRIDHPLSCNSSASIKIQDENKSKEISSAIVGNLKIEKLDSKKGIKADVCLKNCYVQLDRQDVTTSIYSSTKENNAIVQIINECVTLNESVKEAEPRYENNEPSIDSAAVSESKPEVANGNDNVFQNSKQEAEEETPIVEKNFVDNTKISEEQNDFSTNVNYQNISGDFLEMLTDLRNTEMENIEGFQQVYGKIDDEVSMQNFESNDNGITEASEVENILVDKLKNTFDVNSKENVFFDLGADEIMTIEIENGLNPIINQNFDSELNTEDKHALEKCESKLKIVPQEMMESTAPSLVLVRGRSSSRTVKPPQKRCCHCCEDTSPSPTQSPKKCRAEPNTAILKSPKISRRSRGGTMDKINAQ